MSGHEEFRIIHVNSVAPTQVKFTTGLKLMGFESYKAGPGYMIIHTARANQEFEFDITLEAVSEGATWDREKKKALGCFQNFDGTYKVVLQHLPVSSQIIPPDPQEIVDLMERSVEQAGQSSVDAVKVMHNLIKHYDHLDDAQRKQLMDMCTDKMFLKDMIDLDVSHEQFLQNLSAVLFSCSAGRLNWQTRDLLRKYCA